MSRKAMQVALEALESDPISHAGLVTVLSPGKGTGFNYARASQKTAVSPDGGTGFIDGVWHEPAQRKPLTDSQIREIAIITKGRGDIEFARAIEAAHGITGEKA